MNEANVVENLGFLARHCEREAARLESLGITGGDYEKHGTPYSPSQLSAPQYLRQRAKMYLEAQEMMKDYHLPAPDPVPTQGIEPVVIMAAVVSVVLFVGVKLFDYFNFHRLLNWPF